MALKVDGSVYAWGSNTRGKFGTPESQSEEYQVPQKIGTLTAIKTLACGTWHVLALDVYGSVFSSGSNKHFELGRGGGGGDGFQKVEAMQKSSKGGGE